MPLTEAEVRAHVLAVVEATGLPLCLYNNPTTTRFTFSHALIAELAQVPGIAAVKMPFPPDGDVSGEIGRLRGAVREGFVVGYSGDWGSANALLTGADAWFSVVAGLLPAPALALARAAQRGDVTETLRLDTTFQPLWALLREFGSFRVMYAMAEHLSLGRFEPPRPVLPQGTADHARVGAAMERLAAAP